MNAVNKPIKKWNGQSKNPTYNKYIFSSQFIGPSICEIITYAIINVRMAIFEEIPKSCSASWDKTILSNPIIPPTKALITTNSEN